ncbi:MAG: outer membrane protein assembly factor BamA [Rhizobiaceae bacterium]|nr:outer membrane protein assembly factor BamA [Rhizobiaceae bacterium]MCV0407198.1 outer membrane protein assembly factor BamA [Rhizobiaceae bacterium]
MKAAVKFLSAVSVVGLTAGAVSTGVIVSQLTFAGVAHAAVVSSIEVRGNRRVDDETIRNYVGITPGRNFTNADIDEGVKNLFGTGLFSDVRINQRGSTLVVEVDEYSIVNQVIFQGNRKIKDADLARAAQLQPRGAFSSATMEADAEGIRQAYSRIGRDDATVTTQVIDLGENRVNVVFEINEGDRTKIASINFVGNNAFPDRRLADVISTKRSSILSVLFRDDVFDESKLRADEEALRRFYYNRGYADFQVVSSYGELNEAANEYTVTITVDEGERYTFGDISIESTIPGVEPESLRGLLKTREGAPYSAKNVEDTIIGLTERVAGLGYAFAQVTPRGDRNFENRTISVVYTIDQGPRTYVERIEIRGNTRTRDYVIRREFDVSEGDAFNQVLIQRAKRRLENLDFFTTVNISTVPGSEPDQVILVVDVVEKATGEFSIGAGYSTGNNTRSSTGGFSVEGSVTERNFLGRGQFIRVSGGGGANTRDYGLSFTEPYFLGRRIAAGFDIYRQTREFDLYDSELTGATVRFGLPITEELSTTLAYNYASEEYKYSEFCDTDGDGVPNGPGDNSTINGTPCGIAPAIGNAIATSPWTKSSVSASLIYNTIDDKNNPRDGIYATFTTEVAGLGGDAQWVKFTGRGNYYRTLNEEMDLVGLITVGGGHIVDYGDEGLRVFDMFQNTTRIIRGFEGNGFGPYQQASNGAIEHLGGTTYFHATAEAQFPLPVVPPSLGLRGAFFADAATLYGNGLSPAAAGGPVFGTGMEWRASVGASLIWASPFGPLRVDYAIPVVKEPTDDVQNFNFGISTRF